MDLYQTMKSGHSTVKELQVPITIKKFYTWTEDNAWIRATFLKHAARQYSLLLHGIKMNKDKLGKPGALSDAGWELFKQYWELGKTQRRSAQMSANRKSEAGVPGGGMSRHCQKDQLLLVSFES